MNPTVMAGLVLALALAACAPPPGEPGSYSGGDSASSGDRTGAAARIAVTHSFTLRVPGDEVGAIQQRHLAECAELGCVVLNTRLDRLNAGRINARLSVRVSPENYRRLATILASPPAEVVTHSETSEDKTVAFLDVEKRLGTKSALRDRLTALLNDPNTKSPGDLAAIEKELAQVQGDIEAATAQRDYIQTITETIKVDISYDGRTTVAAGFDSAPIRQAIDSSGRTLLNSIASLISFLVAVLPWIPVIIFGAWAVRRGLRRWRAQKASS